MNTTGHETAKKSQSDKFKDAAREAECDEDEARWADSLKRIAQTPTTDKE